MHIRRIIDVRNLKLPHVLYKIQSEHY